MQGLTERKEELENELARKLPHLVGKQPGCTELARALPRRAAFVDLLVYSHQARGPRDTPRLHYVAFVLRRGQPVRRVELGPAAPLDKALAAWRRDLLANRSGPAAATVRRLAWEPLVKHLPARTSVVYLCPDGPLSAVPWAALPGRRPGTVLLEEHAVALVPHGPFLLEQLSRPARATGAGLLLALGGVRYDGQGAEGRPWVALPGTAAERRQVAALARRLPRPPRVRERGGAEAGTDQLLADLPKARWAHLATHGFFAAPDSQEREKLYAPRDFLRGPKGERRGAAARNPLALSGLVLAGANRPAQDKGADRGILTGEAIAGLDLSGLELAVLSACETGLGEAQTGEGIFGLQRAFHLAGTPNVVASLWKVNDQATAALMALFYHFLWEQKQGPLEALRSAQLALYRHPRDLPALAERGSVNFARTVKRVVQPAAPNAARPRDTAPARFWAAFVLSGAGGGH